jgi:hypothetical protein
MNESIKKLLFVIGKVAETCREISERYDNQIKSAKKCAGAGVTEAGRIRASGSGFDTFLWKWEDCSRTSDNPFLEDGKKHKLPSTAVSSPDQDGGSMRPGRGRSAVTPTVLNPVFIAMEPALAPPSRAQLDAHKNSIKCGIRKEENEILYSLEMEKLLARYNNGCDPFQSNIPEKTREARLRAEKIRLERKYRDFLDKILKTSQCKKTS